MNDEQTSNNKPPEQPAPDQPTSSSSPAPQNKKTTEQVLMEELNPEFSGPTRRRRILQTIGIPLLAILTGLILGAFFIVLTSPEFYAALRVSLWDGVKMAVNIVATTYGAWLKGMFGDPENLVQYFQTGNSVYLRQFFYPISEGLTISTPYIFGGLSVALAFRAGMFNIGAEGQIFLGAVFATYVGYSFTGLPWFLHIPLAFLAGALGGFLWGFIPGFLKASQPLQKVFVILGGSLVFFVSPINAIITAILAFAIRVYETAGIDQSDQPFHCRFS